jgi:NADP-dependent 3-hydroxy acid dehydrogenase YdfG
MSAGLAIITGGSSGLGLAVARRLSADGWSVVITGRNPEALDRAVAEIGRNCHGFAADVGDPAAMAEIVARVNTDMGSVTALVANAGTNVAKRAWSEVSSHDFSTVVDINVNGVFNAINAVLPGMRARRAGRIVAVSSFAGWHVTPQPGPAYTSSKMAVLGLIASLNMAEVRNGICATALCPGEIATPAMFRRVPPPTPEVLARMLQADDVANAVAFILSQPSRVAINELVITPSRNNAYNRVPGPPFED